jgi:hypothetical protein
MDNFRYPPPNNLNLDKNPLNQYKNKHEKFKKNKFMRFLSTLIILICIGYGVYWINNNQPELKHKALEMIYTRNLSILEARFTANQIIQNEEFFNESEPIKEPILRYHPYVLMEVKFTSQDAKTEEGVILWDQVDGEMITDTRTWDKTHGFSDCMNANADRYEYQILKTIAKNKGKATRQSLQNALNLDPHLLEAWIERTYKKKLIIHQGEFFRIHLHNPVITVEPSTYTSEPLVTKNIKQTESLASRYSSKQIIKAAESAFGDDFAIRNTQNIFLPVYCITTKNPDGSCQTTHWNALNGKRIPHSNLIE